MVFQPSLSGISTLTHYTLPSNYIASCGCVGSVTDYPTAAINRLSYDSDSSFGPRCGSCVRLTLQSTPLATSWDPIDFSENGRNSSQKAPSVIVKLVDACPIQGEWCNSTMTQGNKLGYQVHFDLAWPSKGISDDFFPGEHEYGVWTSLYEYVSCTEWAGYDHQKALGSDWTQSNAACCPANPPLPQDESNSSNNSIPQEPSSISSTSSETSISTSTSIPISSINSTATSNSTSSSNTSFNTSSQTSSFQTSIPISSSASSLRSSTTISSRVLKRSQFNHHQSSKRQDSNPILSNQDQFKQCPSYSDLIASSSNPSLGITSELNSLIPNTSNILSKNDASSNGAMILNNIFSLLNFKSNSLNQISNENSNGNDKENWNVKTIPNLKHWVIESMKSPSTLFSTMIKRNTNSDSNDWKFDWKNLRGKLWMRALEEEDFQSKDFNSREEKELEVDQLDFEKFGKPPLLRELGGEKEL